MTPISRECPLLPKDLIIQILLRSRVKTLLRFKSVCKDWQAIINSSCFQYQHVGRESNCTDLIVCWSGCLVDECNDGDNPSFEVVGSISLFRNGILDSNPMELWEGLSEGVVRHVCGPCNGIIGVCYSDSTYALWNPATRKLWPIPEHPLIMDLCEASFSFWIDPSTNEFQIFWITPECNERVSRSLNFITYSSSNNSWTQIEPPIYLDEHVDLFHCRYSVTSGFFYFLKYNWSTCSYTIIGYDVSNELFEEIHMPEVEIHSLQEIVLDLYGDSLALFFSDTEVVETGHTKIWVMKEKGCWVKLFNVGIHNLCQALGFWKENEIFISRYTDEFMMNHELVIYDLLSGTSRKVEVEKVNGANDKASIPLRYKESLISVRHWI